MTDHNAVVDLLEGRAPALFLVAGIAMIAFGTNTYLKTFVGTSYLVVQLVVAPAGFLTGVLGLFGLYPALADRAPRLARVAAGTALITTAGWVVIIVNGIGGVLGVLSQPTGPLAVVPLVVIVTMILGFGLFGATVLHTESYPWLVGALLLLESAMFLVLILDLAPYLLLIDAGHVVAFLGTAGALWKSGAQSARAEPAPDSPA